LFAASLRSATKLNGILGKKINWRFCFNKIKNKRKFLS